MPPSFCQSFVAFLLKFLNFLQTFVGVSILLYSVWLLNRWNKDELGGGFSFHFDLDKLPAPWFICVLMGIGVLMCLIAVTGNIAAETINGCCLCFYALFISVLIVLEAALVGDLVFNKQWEEDLPHDSTGELKRLRAFIEDNLDICKWVSATVIIIQALSLLVAIILRGMVPTRNFQYDSDEDYVVMRPLLNPQGGSTFASTSVDSKGFHSDIWSSRMRQKYGLNQNQFA